MFLFLLRSVLFFLILFICGYFNWSFIRQFTLNKFGILHAKDYRWSLNHSQLLIQLSQIHLSRKTNQNQKRWLHILLYYLARVFLNYVTIEIKSLSIQQDTWFVFIDHITLTKNKSVELKTGTIQLFDSQKRILEITSSFTICYDDQTRVALGSLDIFWGHLPLVNQGHETKKHWIHTLDFTVQAIHLHYESRFTLIVDMGKTEGTLTKSMLMNFNTQAIQASCSRDALLFQLGLPHLEFDCALDSSFKNIHLFLDTPIISLEKAFFELVGQKNQQRHLPMFAFALVLCSPKIIFPTTNGCQFYLGARDFIVRLLPDSNEKLNAHYEQEEAQWLDKKLKRRLSTVYFVHLTATSSRALVRVLFQRLKVGYYSQQTQREVLSIKRGKVIVQKGGLSGSGELQADVTIEKPSIHLWQDLTMASSFLKSNGEESEWTKRLKMNMDISNISVSVSGQDENTSRQAPMGYLNNAPQTPVLVHMALHLQKLTWDNQHGCQLSTLSIEQMSNTTEPQLIFWISHLDWQPNPCTLKIKTCGLIYSIENYYSCLVVAKSFSYWPKAPRKHSNHDVYVSVERGDLKLNFVEPLFLRINQLSTQGRHGRFQKMMVLGRMNNGWRSLIKMDLVEYDVLDFTAQKVFVCVPFGYKLAPVIRSLICDVKAIKDLQARLFRDAFTFVGPQRRDDPMEILPLKVILGVLTAVFDDDPFEVKLRRIFRTGLIEQEKRLAYQEAFDQKTAESKEADIQQAEYGLKKKFSELWKKYIDKTIAEESKVESVGENDFGDSLDMFSSIFSIFILPRPLCPSLVHFTAQSVCIELKKSRISQPRDFIHQIGGGVPHHFPYSLLLPFSLSIYSGQTLIKIRDYPFWLIQMPDSWSLEGDYVMVDELGDSSGSRLIPVSVLPDYTMSIVRVTSPIKFYSTVRYTIKGSSMIGWSVSCKPAIQDIMGVLSSLLPAPVDPSPPLAWWDKICFGYHSRIQIEFNHDLALLLKGTRDPYEQQKGMAMLWSQDVKIKIGHQETQPNFLEIKSRAFLMGVPNETFSEEPGFLKVVLRLSGDISMGIGIHFERLEYGADVLEELRSQPFIAHHQVKLKAPNHVVFHKLTYDAYKNFRSDFIHLSFYISQSDQEASGSHNAIYLNQSFLDHFSAWYRLFGGPLALPIKQGTLWPNSQRKHKAMGESLDTLKYRLSLDSISIGFFCSPEESFLDQEEAVGLKAYARDFKVDLHSKRNWESGKRSFHEAILMMNDMDLRLVKALVDKTLIEKKTSVTESEYYVGSAATKVADDCHWEDVEDYVLLEPSSTEYRAIEVYPFVFSPLICFKRHGGDTRREYLRMTHDCIVDTKTDARDFQKSYLYCRASDLQKQIEELDKQLDMINKALDICNYIGYHELKRQHEQISLQIESLRKKHLLLNEYICQVVLEKELASVTSAFGDPLSDFKDRCFLHSPQIIWNTSVRDILLYWNELKETRTVQTFNLSAQCLQFLSALLPESQPSEYEGHSKLHDILESTFGNREAKSKVLVDAFYPQIVFQSDAEHLLLVTNERMQVQILDLLDDRHLLVKNRCMLSLEDGHMFAVASNNEERCYGQMDSKKHWATWIYPEQLWKQVSKNYTKISSNLSGKVQLDVYNPLRIKRYPYAEIASTVLRLDFPKLKWAADSLETRLVYLTLVDLFLNQKLTKWKLMQETLLLSAERSDLTESIREVRKLQRLSRHFIQMHSIFLKRQSHLDSLGKKQHVDNKQRMQDCLQRLHLVILLSS
ncbi:unnamed protein product [Rhizopus stolonifer]